jgi:hypothetical protein
LSPSDALYKAIRYRERPEAQPPIKILQMGRRASCHANENEREKCVSARRTGGPNGATCADLDTVLRDYAKKKTTNQQILNW